MTQWGWRAGLTKPQIDLLLYDQPVVDYKTTRKKGKKEKRDYTSYSVRAKAEKALASCEAMNASGEDVIGMISNGGITFNL